MLDEKWVIVGAIIGFVGVTSYLIDTLKGKVKPNRVSWFLWAVAPMIAFWAEISQGVGLQSLLTFMVGFGPLLVFIASFVNKKSYWQIGRLDWICGAMSVVGLILWGITRVGNIAIFFSILADGLAAVPTVIKSYWEPETENGTAFLLNAIAAIFTLLTIDAWNFEHYAFPVYILVICSLLYVLIEFKLGKKITLKTS